MAVLSLMSAVAGFVKVRYLQDKSVIDNMVFRLHYRITSAIFFASCMIITANNLIGDPINCLSDGGVVTHVINTFCWISHTFSMPENYNKPRSHVGHPGLGTDIGEKKYHSYYQWVPFILFFQGILFYIPHWMWKQWEEGKIRMISEGMRGALLENKQERQARSHRLAQYIMETLHMHNSYAAGYFFCEFLNFFNVIINMYFMDSFLGGSFFTYGTDVWNFTVMDQENRVDPMIKVFPRVTKCTFYKYGPSGSIQNVDAMCVLALNILNEKIYIFLWFWFILLAFITGMSLVYSLTIILLPTSRGFILKKRFKFDLSPEVKALVRKTQVGDFLLLHLLGQNMSMMVFNEVMDELCRRLLLGSSSGASPASMPSAPSTLEMSPIFPDIEKFAKDTEI